MDSIFLKKYIEKQFNINILPNLKNFIRIPNLSPAYDINWNTNGLLFKAANLIVSFGKSLSLKNSEINLIQDKGYTPMIYIEIKASRLNDNRTVLFYGHYDKQPHGTGWDPDKSPINPIIIDNHIYGRGAVDDGYAPFSILTAIKTCQDFNYPLPRICVLIEGAEESTDSHLEYYFNKLISILGKNIITFIPLDSFCSDYEHLWITNSLRGIIDFNINIETLQKNSNYGPEANGIIADNLFLVRKIYDGIIDSTNGEVKLEEFKVPNIPEQIEKEMDEEIKIVGDHYINDIPLYEGVSPLSKDIKELMILNRWKPTCNILGVDNCPQIKDNGFGIKSAIKVKMSIRTPPGIDHIKAMEALKSCIEKNTYFGAKVTMDNIDVSSGCTMINLSNRTKTILNKASKEFFGNETISFGVGISIPFINYFQNKYPNTEIICTGICGYDSHQHGGNENLNIEACKKLIGVLCYFFKEV